LGAEVKEGRWKNGILALMDLVAVFFAYAVRVSPVAVLTGTVAQTICYKKTQTHSEA
jgi:CRISPR/Cas system-associated protein Cas7 (RAMP superfamily)